MNQEAANAMDAYLIGLAKQKEFNGAVLVAKDGKIVYEKYLGFCDINAKTKLGPRSSFRLASVSKHFTAMGIMILKEQGKLDFDDDIRKHLPTLPYDGVTIRHLLHHNGGLPDYVGWFNGNWDTRNEIQNRKTAFNRDVVEQFSKSKPHVLFKPGDMHEYSNTGYVMLGQIIEVASGIPIREFFKTEVFDPLEMKDSQAFSPGADFTVAERVHGFAYLADGIGHEDNDWNYLNGMIGDGGIYASVRDLLKWEQAWYGEKLVSQKTIAEAYKSGKTNDGKETSYGFGWILNEDSKGNLLGVTHSGSWVGFLTNLDRDFESRWTEIVLASGSANGLGSVVDVMSSARKGTELNLPPKNIAYELAEVVEAKSAKAAVDRFGEIKDSKSKRFRITDRLIEDLAEHYRKTDRKNVANEIASILTARPKVVLTEKQLEQFVGTYPLSESFRIKISRRGKSLFAQATGQFELSLKPIEKDRFKVVNVDAEISFTGDENGKTESLTLHQGGVDHVAPKSK